MRKRTKIVACLPLSGVEDYMKRYNNAEYLSSFQFRYNTEGVNKKVSKLKMLPEYPQNYIDEINKICQSRTFEYLFIDIDLLMKEQIDKLENNLYIILSPDNLQDIYVGRSKLKHIRESVFSLAPISEDDKLFKAVCNTFVPAKRVLDQVKSNHRVKWINPDDKTKHIPFSTAYIDIYSTMYTEYLYSYKWDLRYTLMPLDKVYSPIDLYYNDTVFNFNPDMNLKDILDKIRRVDASKISWTFRIYFHYETGNESTETQSIEFCGYDRMEAFELFKDFLREEKPKIHCCAVCENIEIVYNNFDADFYKFNYGNPLEYRIYHPTENTLYFNDRKITLRDVYM